MEKNLKILHIAFPEENNNKSSRESWNVCQWPSLGKQELGLSWKRAEHRVVKTEVPEARSTVLGGRWVAGGGMRAEAQARTGSVSER